MGYALGIDLGTTYTAAAVSDGSHAEVINLGDRSPQAPSVIYQGIDGTFRCGEAAERRATTEPERIAREFKRRMGDQTPIFVGGTPLSAHACAKALLSWTIEQVVNGQGEEPDRVIVTCPANWGPYRRELMSQVTALNADYPITVCTEPEAAALHFASTRRVAEGQSIAVYDLGGGTFDAAVLRRGPGGSFEVLGAPDGVEQLGGVDFDEAVFERVSRSIEADGLDPDDPETLLGLAQLRRSCTEAKEALSSETETIVPITLGGQTTRVRLTRAEFNELIGPLIGDTLDVLDRVIRRSGVATDELAAIVLVGGSSRVPLISERITQRFGRPAVLSPQPKLCVAMGAALLGASLDAGNAGSSTETPARPSGPVIQTAAMAPTPTVAPAPAASVPPPAAAVTPSVAPTPAPAPTAAPAPTTPAESSAPAVPVAAPVTPTPSPVPPAAVTPPPPEAPAPAAASGAAPPAARSRGGVPVYRLISAVCAVGAILLMLFGTTADKSGMTWNDDFKVSAAGLPKDAALTPTIFGISLMRPPEPIKAKAFDLHSRSVFLAGPTRAEITSAAGPREVVLSAAERWSPRRWLSIPFGALALTALFSIAYMESILRPIRRRRIRAKSGDVIGLIGSGIALGIAGVLATWVIGDRLPQVPTALGIIVLVCAAVGLLAFVWPPRERPSPTR